MRLVASTTAPATIKTLLGRLAEFDAEMRWLAKRRLVVVEELNLRVIEAEILKAHENEIGTVIIDMKRRGYVERKVK